MALYGRGRAARTPVADDSIDAINMSEKVCHQNKQLNGEGMLRQATELRGACVLDLT